MEPFKTRYNVKASVGTPPKCFPKHLTLHTECNIVSCSDLLDLLTYYNRIVATNFLSAELSIVKRAVVLVWVSMHRTK